jgi:hypothetical protein
VKKHTFRWMIVSVLVAASTDAPAKPPAGGVFCQKYPTSPECMGRQPSCTYCHIAPPQRNAFGTMVSQSLLPGLPRPLSDGDFAAALPSALTAVEGQDADGDGVPNLTEIQQGTLPADPNSKPLDAACQGSDNPQFSVCRYDLRHAYKKVVRDLCGASPTFAEVTAFAARPSDDDRRAFIDSEDGALCPDRVLARQERSAVEGRASQDSSGRVAQGGRGQGRGAACRLLR